MYRDCKQLDEARWKVIASGVTDADRCDLVPSNQLHLYFIHSSYTLLIFSGENRLKKIIKYEGRREPFAHRFPSQALVDHIIKTFQTIFVSKDRESQESADCSNA